MTTFKNLKSTNRITGMPRCFSNRGLFHEYRQPKLVWRAAKRILTEDTGKSPVQKNKDSG